MISSADFRSRTQQQAQMLVIFAGALILILAVAALVVDLGFVFMQRRQEQNAADPGALAAARYIPAKNTGQMWTAACFYAVQNGFAPRRSDNNVVCDATRPDDGSILTVNYPPSVAAAEYAGNPGYVQVTMSRRQQSFFAGVIGMPSIAVSASAVAAFDTGASGTSSLVALKPTGCSTAKIHGWWCGHLPGAWRAYCRRWLCPGELGLRSRARFGRSMHVRSIERHDDRRRHVPSLEYCLHSRLMHTEWLGRDGHSHV